MHMDMTAIGNLATVGTEAPQGLGQQLEYLFAQQLLAALSRTSEKQGERSEYLSLLSDPLAREMAAQGALGIGRQLGEGEEVSP